MKSRFEAIDVLRGLAALGIALYHVRVDLWVGWHSAFGPQSGLFNRVLALLALPIPFFGGGVMLFFVVSGFCIHYPYVLRREKFQTLPYPRRRLLRIYPPYLVAVAFTIPVELGVKELR